jgi:hypothetical protein
MENQRFKHQTQYCFDKGVDFHINSILSKHAWL